MLRTARTALIGVTLIALWGCGASVDGGSGSIKEGPDLGTTLTVNQSSAAPGTNLVLTAEIRNGGTDATSGGALELITDGWPVVQTAELGEVQFSCVVDGGGSCENIRLIENIVVADLALDPGATATFAGRLPLFYLSDSDASSVSIEVCAVDGPSATDDTNPDDNCDSAEAGVDAAQSLVEFQDEVIYWAMTDRFFNGDPTNDDGNGDRLGDEADPSNPRGWHGGDFAGLKAKIEEGYFQAMGFTAIWISPVVYQIPAIDNGDFPGYHGYWLENYDDPEPHFGSWAELNDLVATAHANGLKILIDLVVNHAGYGAQIVDTEPDWFRTGSECGSVDDRITQCLAGLPDTRQEVEEARRWALDGARNVLLQSGADGFRIDTYKHVNEDFWYDFFAAGGPGDRSSVWSIGEYFDPSSQRMAEALDRDGSPSVFDFPLYGALNAALADRSQTTDGIATIFGNDGVFDDPTRLTTFVDNHDVPRFVTRAIDAGATTAEAQERLSMAVGLMYASRGVPSVYYGTEIALQGGGDPDNRRDMVFPEAGAFAKTRPAAMRKSTCGVTGSGDPAEAYGAEIFVRGSFDDWADPPTAGSRFENMGGNVYEAEFAVTAESYDFKVASADWSTADFTADGTIALDASTTLLPGAGLGNSNIVIPADGCYNFRLDTTDTAAPVLTVTEVELDGGGPPPGGEVDLVARLTQLAAARASYPALRGGGTEVLYSPASACAPQQTGNDPTEAFGVEMFARGGFNGWADPPPAGDAFANLGGDVYEARVSLASGDQTYKVAAADWSSEWALIAADSGATPLDTEVTMVTASGPGTEGSISIAETGCYTFTMNAGDTSAPTLTVSQLFAGTGPDVLAFRRDLDGEATVIAIINNDDEPVDLAGLDGGIPAEGLTAGAAVEITGAETDLQIAGGRLTGTVPPRTTYLVSDR
jgi:hypothetical protein